MRCSRGDCCSFDSCFYSKQHGDLHRLCGEKPGVIHRITVKDLPPPDATPSVDNGPDLVRRPAGAWPQAPAGFKVELYASGLKNPRLIRTAPPPALAS